MLYINIKTEFHKIDKNLPDYGLETTGGEDIDYMLKDIVDHKTGKADVNLFYCEIVRSKIREEKSYYYELQTKKSLFNLLYYIEKHSPKTREIFDYWRAQRQDRDYYLELIVYSVLKELISDYISMVSDWCKSNGELSIQESLFIPPETKYADHDLTIDIPIEYIKKIEKNKKSCSYDMPIYWDTGFPGFEGAGSDTALTWVNTGIALIGLLSYYGLYSKYKNKKTLTKLRKEIYEKFNIQGILQAPDINHPETDSELRLTYRFTQFINNKPYAYYIVRFDEPCYQKKKTKKATYTITEEKALNRKSKRKN
jgi:hypothetical protein